MNCPKCSAVRVLTIDDDRELHTYAAEHANNINGKPCGGHAQLVGRKGRVPPKVIPKFPAFCSDCAQGGVTMAFVRSAPLPMLVCPKCG